MAAHKVVMVTGYDKVHRTRDQDGEGGETQRDTAMRKRRRIYIFGQ